MGRLFILLLVAAIVVVIARHVWISLLQLRVGAVPGDVDVPDVALVADRGWQVTRRVHRGIAEITVEHPVDGPVRTWTVHLREPGAARQLEQTMADAGRLVADFTTKA